MHGSLANGHQFETSVGMGFEMLVFGAAAPVAIFWECAQNTSGRRIRHLSFMHVIISIGLLCNEADKAM